MGYSCSHVGYATKEVEINGSDVSITLEASCLGDVVIVGYGAQHHDRRYVSITSKDIGGNIAGTVSSGLAVK